MDSAKSQNNVNTHGEYGGVKKLRKEEIKRKLTEVESNLVSKNDEDLSDRIRKQMEFYFGDANLSKDKFLRDLTMNNKKGYVDLTIFLNFKKVKSFLYNEPDKSKQLYALSSAIENSKILSLNKAKTKVKRKIPFDQSEIDEDLTTEKTIYIENFPETVDHEGLAKVFSKVGTILHISIPRYPDSKAPKGFAFIQYSVSDYLFI